MPRSITGFRSQLVGSGARPNLFQISMTFPLLVPIASAAGLVTFMAESTSIPADKLGEIEVPYMGRKIYYPGDREFDPWTITVMNDENFAIRDAFELWMSSLNQHEGNIRDSAAAVPAGYTTNAIVQQFSKLDLPPLKQYEMVSFFPTELGAIELDWGTNNTIEKFQVTLRYQWWNAIGQFGPTTDGGAGISLNP
jgi:hypothetical protein